MRRGIILIGFICLLFGCRKQGQVKHTSFFNSHDANKYFSSIAKNQKLEMGANGSGLAYGGPTGEKDFKVSIKGDTTLRDKLMRTYKAYVEDSLNGALVKIEGRGVSGKVSGFDFSYYRKGVTGLIKVNAVVDYRGYIQIEIFMYEHK